MIRYNFALPLVFIILLLITTFLFIIMGKKTFEYNEKSRFSFRNYFPFEIYYQSNIKVVSYFRILIIFFFALLIVIPIIFATSFRGNNLPFAIVTGLLFIFTSLVALMLFMIKPNYLKQFKIYSTLLIVFNILANGMFAISSISSLYSYFAYKIIGGFSFAISAFNVLLAINPKLSKWDKLDKIDNLDGTTSYIRPKISPLAFSLWLSEASLVLGELLLLTSLLISSLNI